MKNLILSLCMLFAFAINLSAQTKTVDSTYYTAQGGIFYATHVTTYDNGESITMVTLAGDTATFNRRNSDNFRQRATTMSTDATAVFGFKSSVTEMLRQAQAMEALLGQTGNPIKSIVAQDFASLSDPATVWNCQDSTVVFTVTNSGQLRYRAGAATMRNAYYFGRLIVFVNWLGTGQRLDLYQVQDNKFATIDGAVALKRQKAGNKPAK
jgi:hypothetical protein